MPTTQSRFARCLFWLGLALAGLLAAVVLLAPLLDDRDASGQGWPRLIALFARDITLRRTCLASAAGLLVSACVFYRPGHKATPANASERPPRPRWPGVAGA